MTETAHAQKTAQAWDDSAKIHGTTEFFEATDLHAYYGESYIVQGVSFDVREGEIVALLGRNGAGKTSTLRAISRLDQPGLTHGEIWLDHQPLHNMSSYEAATVGLGLVPEDLHMLPWDLLSGHRDPDAYLVN